MWSCINCLYGGKFWSIGMNTTRFLSGLALTVMLAPAASASTIWLKDPSNNICKNTLSSNPGQVIGYGGIDASGNFTMTISNPNDGVVSPSASRAPCTSLPKTGSTALGTAHTINFNGTMTPQFSTLNMVKPGTKGALECLAQGSNLSGVGANASGTGQAITDSTNIYTLTMKYAFNPALDDGCVAGTTPPQYITGDGQPNFVYPHRSATWSNGTTTINLAYHIFNANTVPEPGSLALLLSGASVAVAAFWLRRRKPAGHN